MMKNDRGVALATLIMAVIIMVIMTGTITYTSLDTIKLRKLDDMYNDIRLLNQKVTNYYIENKELPVLETVISKTDLPEEIKSNNVNDGYEYRIIDLEKLGGITLKYGKEYKEYTTNNKDVYIINYVSHTIYYLQGIEIDLKDEDGKNIKKYALEENYDEIILPTVIPTPTPTPTATLISRLPVEYQEVEYIESTGTQYIDIGYIPKENDKYEMKFKHTNVNDVNS